MSDILVITHTLGDRDISRTCNSVAAALQPGCEHIIIPCKANYAQERYRSLKLAKFVAFVDDDDTLHPEALIWAQRALKLGYTFVVTNEVLVNENQEIIREVTTKKTYQGITAHPRVAHHLCVIEGSTVDPWVVDLHKEYSVGIDWAIKASAASRGNIVHIPQGLYNWTQTPDSMNQREREVYSKVMPEISQKLRSFLPHRVGSIPTLENHG